MKPLLLALPGNEVIGERLAVTLAAEYAVPEVRNIPDGKPCINW